MIKFKTLLFALSGIIPLFGGIGNPTLGHSVVVLFYFLRSRVTSVIEKIPLHAQVKLGLLIMIFSLGILESLSWLGEYLAKSHNPALFHPQLIPDLLATSGFYFGHVIAWLILLRFFKFSLPQVFITQGLYGVLAEGNGAIFMQGLTTFPLGIWLWVFVFFAYAPAVGTAYLLTENQLKQSLNPQRNSWIKYPLTIILMYILAVGITFTWGAFLFDNVLPPPKPIWEAPFW